MTQVTIELETAQIAKAALNDLVSDYAATRHKWDIGDPYRTRLTQERDHYIKHLTALKDAIYNATSD